MKNQDIHIQIQSISSQIIVNNKEKSSNFIVEKPGRNFLNQLIKVSITKNGTNQNSPVCLPKT